MRTIAGQAGYGTGEGIRVEASWQHRNLLPPEGAVTFRGVAGTQEQLVGAVLQAQQFPAPRPGAERAGRGQPYRPRRLRRAHLPARRGRSSGRPTSSGRRNGPGRLGAELVATDERDVDLASGMTRRRTFFIGALPASLSYDGSNDLLDPTTGYRLAWRFSPEASLQSGTFGYARTQIDASFYQPFTPTVTLAGRVRLGTIFGAGRDRIAPSRRFYAGGGGSVRGYGFQRLGPRDPVFDDPIGGRSLTEFAIEARDPLAAIGASCPSSTAATSTTSPLPKFDNLRFGAGIGVRYHTRFGPIRVDVGTPLNRRERRCPGRRLRLARPGLLMDEGDGPAAARRAAAAGCRGWRRSVVGLALALACSPRRWRCCSTPAPATASSPTGSPRWRRNRASGSTSAGSRARSGATPGFATSGSTTRRACSRNRR